MNWVRYSGRIMLAVGVIAAAIYATREKLLDLPVYQFWVGILSYLIAAEVVWTLVDRRPAQPALKLVRQGLRRLAHGERQRPVPALWLYDGGRARLSDVQVDNDIVRDAQQPLLAAALTREKEPRLHVISGAPGSGRSTMLLRLARELVEQGQTVFLGLPTADLPGLPLVLEAAKKGQVYLLLDDLDLRPQAEEWMYEIFRTRLPVVVVATATHGREPQADCDGVDALAPAGFLAQATLHRPTVTPNDLPVLALKLGTLKRQQKAAVPPEAAGDMVQAMRHLQGREPQAGLWDDLDRGADLPAAQKLMLALCGIAEVGLPAELAGKVLGEQMLPRWQKAGLLAVEEALVLPPHHSVCLELVERRPEDAAAALAQLLALSDRACPLLAPRLLFGLCQFAQTQPLVKGCASRLPAPALADDPLQRMWGRVGEALGEQVTRAEAGNDHPPQLSLLIDQAMTRGDYEQAVQLGRRLAHSPIYAATAHFNLALALAHLGRFAEAEEELEQLQPEPPGTMYLRGVLAEQRGDYTAALDAYETSRKQGELIQPTTRRLAFCQLRSGAPKAAISLFEVALSHTPQRADLYGGLAVAHFKYGMPQRAAAQSARAIQAGVEPARARKAVARACVQAGAYDRAAGELEACVAYDPDDLEAWAELATACHAIGRLEREAQCLQRVQPQHRPPLQQAN